MTQKTGFLIFKTHVYTQDELLRSEHHGMIYAITEKIGDDADNWYKAGKLSNAGRDAYYAHRERVEQDLHSVNKEIMQREATWWEKVGGVLTQFVGLIKHNMPDLVRHALARAAVILGLPAPLRKIIGLPLLTDG